jgi:YD repeat-containing protein
MREAVNDGLGNKIQTSYTYQGAGMRGDFQDGNLHGREFLGFRTATVQRFETVAETATPSQDVGYELLEFHQAPVSPNSKGAHVVRDPRNGKLTAHRIWSQVQGACTVGAPDPNLGRCLLAETTDTWGAYYLPSTGDWQSWSNQASGPFWVRQDKVLTWRDGAVNSTWLLYAPAEQNGGQYGNLTHVAEYDGDFNGAGSTHLRTIRTEYFPNPTLNIVNKPARVRVYNPQSDCRSEVRTVYDNLNGSYNSLPTLGLPVKTQVALSTCSDTAAIAANDTAWQETRMDYDDWGNPTVLHKVGGGTVADAWVNTSYDNFYHLFPVQQTHTPGGLAETASYYGVWGNGSGGGYGANSAPATSAGAYWGAMAEHCGVNEVCTR